MSKGMKPYSTGNEDKLVTSLVTQLPKTVNTRKHDSDPNIDNVNTGPEPNMNLSADHTESQNVNDLNINYNYTECIRELTQICIHQKDNLSKPVSTSATTICLPSSELSLELEGAAQGQI